MPLRNRQQQIPNPGLSYLQPETGWKPKRFSSFDSICSQLIAHRLGNPHLIRQNGWSVDRKQVEDEVDNYNTRICLQMGWGEYITEGGGLTAIPFTRDRAKHNLLQSLRNVAAGSFAIVEFLDRKEDAVSSELSAHRAEVCVQCPKNQPGNWLALFTEPAANVIRHRIQDKEGMGLSTPSDLKLGVCSACDCPMPLKVHFPIDLIWKRLSEQAKADLHPDCWIPKEQRAPQ